MYGFLFYPFLETGVIITSALEYGIDMVDLENQKCRSLNLYGLV